MMNMNVGYIPQPQLVFSGDHIQLPLAVPESGLVVNSHVPIAGNPTSRKRPHGDDVPSQLHQQLLDVDRLVLQHTESVRIEMMERGQRFLKQVISSMEQNVAKRVKAKDEEIERIVKLNWALEERIKSLILESQIWREMAQSNEATANMLRCSLDQALMAAAQTRPDNDHDPNEDAESCCCGEANDENNNNNIIINYKGRGCRRCQRREASVLLLPCRHLCLCTACGPVVEVCPVCSCRQAGTVHVNLS